MNFSYYCGWRFFRSLYQLYFRWRVFHPERVPSAGPVILASNHASYIDPPMIGCGLQRQIAFLARASLFRFPLFGPLIRSWNAFPVDREGGRGKGLKVVLDLLEKGEGVVLFPEGTRTQTGEFLPAEAGIGLMVIKSNAPVVPVRIWGTFEAFGRHVVIPRPYRIQIKYGYPLDFAAERAEAKICTKQRLKEIYLEISKKILWEIARLKPGRDVSQFPE